VAIENTKGYTMNDEQRQRTCDKARILEASVEDLRFDMRSMSDAVVTIQWEQVQADFEELKQAMEAAQ